MKDMNNNIIEQKITELARIALTYRGKEIAIESNQDFSIFSQYKDNVMYAYNIQYGFPNSGSIHIILRKLEEKKGLFITNFTIYAAKAEKDVFPETFREEKKLGTIEGTATITFKGGIDNFTQCYEMTDIEAMKSNPNVLELLDMALDDMYSAKILGECCVYVPANSDFVPCCISKTMERMPGMKH